MRKLIIWIKGTSTFILFLAPVILSMLLGYFMVQIEKKIYPTGLPDMLIQINGTLFFLIFGCAGIVLVAREEWPTMTWISLRGAPARIIGILWIIFCWGIALMGLVKIIQSII